MLHIEDSAVPLLAGPRILHVTFSVFAGLGAASAGGVFSKSIEVPGLPVLDIRSTRPFQ
jgi:hypothetical protein